MGRRFTSTLLLLIATTGAAAAGTVYVPLSGLQTVGNLHYQPQVLVSSTASAPKNVLTFGIGTDSDGVAPRRQTDTIEIRSQRTTVIQPASSFKGLLEIQTSDEMNVSARLEATGQSSVFVPVIGSENHAAANTTVMLQGLRHDATNRSDITLINLGHEAASCTGTIYQADGIVLSAPATIALRPLSHTYISNLLGTLAPATGLADVRVALTCNKPFFTFGYVVNAASGAVSYVGPSTRGSSGLLLPGATNNGCPVGATCIDQATVFTSTTAKPYGGVSFDAPAAAAYKRVRMAMTVTLGPWYSADPTARHMMYWFVINGNQRMLGTLYLRGTGRMETFFAHGWGTPHAGKDRIKGNHTAQPGRTYRIVNDYDAGNRTVTVTITDLATGAVVHQTVGTTNVGAVPIAAGDRVIVNTGGFPPESVPSYGTIWRDLHIEFYPQ